MNRIANHYATNAEAFRAARQQALQQGFDAGREYERDKLRDEWADDINRAYWAGVYDASRRDMFDVWCGIAVGLLCGLAACALAWAIFG